MQRILHDYMTAGLEELGRILRVGACDDRNTSRNELIEAAELPFAIPHQDIDLAGHDFGR